MVHGAAANTSAQRRTGVALRYMPTRAHFDRSLRPVQGQSDQLPVPLNANTDQDRRASGRFSSRFCGLSRKPPSAAIASPR